MILSFLALCHRRCGQFLGVGYVTKKPLKLSACWVVSKVMLIVLGPTIEVFARSVMKCLSEYFQKNPLSIRVCSFIRTL